MSAAFADMVIVPSLYDLDKPSTLPLRELGAWLHAVVAGKPVVTLGQLSPDTRPSSPECLGHWCASARGEKRDIVVTRRFVAAAPRLATALETLAVEARSKWRVHRHPAAPPAGAHVLDEPADLQAFLRRVQRFSPGRSNLGTYCQRALPARAGGAQPPPPLARRAAR